MLFRSAESGIGYAAISPYQNSDLWREYMETKLNSPFISGKRYCVSWHTSLSNYGSRYGCNRIGAYFSNDTTFQPGFQYDYINVIPGVENLEIITDTLNWTLFKQVYVAQSSEQFMTIGNFRPAALTDTSNVINPSGWVVYYYFDDFGVYELPDIEVGVDDTICTMGGSVQLQATCTGCWAGLQYRWLPAIGLSDTTVLNPIASPSQSTTYYFGLVDTSGTVPCMVDYLDSVTVRICDSLSGIPEYDPFFLQVYPNPVMNLVNLSFIPLTHDGIMLVYDIRGRLILNSTIMKGVGEKCMDISSLESGVYIIVLRSQGLRAVKKFVKT